MRGFLAMVDEFVKFCNDLSNMIKSFESRKFLLKMESDTNAGIVKIYGENADAISRAKNGLEEVSELAYATAEHHPYWNLLYNGSQILQVVLEKWHDVLTEEECNEITWHIDELKNSLEKISGNQSDENPQQR